LNIVFSFCSYSFGQGGVAFFPFINGQIIDKAGISSMMPYTLGLSVACAMIWAILPSPEPTFKFIQKWRQRRQDSEKESADLDQENKTIA
jgi:hypothetical protein